tara:strand:- start:228 stop:593 length:366 start_codon:yes stop_codon:yes gene_type:complete
MPVDPVTRAHFRLVLFRIERDWYPVAEKIIESDDRRVLNRARKELKESILSSAEVFAAKNFFLGDDFSLVDSTIAPILWRLSSFGIELSGRARPIHRYMKKVFERPSFQEGLTELEQEMHQ